MTRTIDAGALRDTIEAVRNDPTTGRLTFAIDGAWDGGLRLNAATGRMRQGDTVDEARSGRFTLRSDEPEQLLGSDTAVSPTEYVLQALAGCYTATIAANAALRGITIEGFRLDLEADLDLRGFLGIDESVRPGIQQVRVRVHLDAPGADRRELADLIAAVQARSVIRDTLVNPVEVTTTLEES